MRLRLLALALAGAVLLPACIKDETVVKLKTDGSGTIEKTTTMSKEMFKQLEEMTKSMGGGEGQEGAEAPKPKQPFSEDEAREEASKLGEGVTFVSWEKVETDTGIGMKAVYAFEDITKVVLNQGVKNPSGDQGPQGGGEEKKKEPITFQFEKGGASSKLTVLFPGAGIKPEGEETPEGAETPEGEEPPPPSEPKEPDPQELEQMKAFFKDMKVSIVVEAGAEVVNTNSLFVEGPRVTLLEMDFGALMDNMDQFKELAKLKPKTLEETKELLKDVKGFKINPDQQITIEFK